MKVLDSIVIFSLLGVTPCWASAQEIGRNDFSSVSDLALAGFEPFPVSSTAKASFGMKKGTDMFICFLADNEDLAAERREVISRAMQENEASRELPNIPVVCVLAE